MASKVDQVSAYWNSYLDLRGQGEWFGAMRELGLILLTVDRLPPADRARWRKRVRSESIGPGALDNANRRASGLARRFFALVGEIDGLIYEEQTLLVSLAQEFNAVEAFLAAHKLPSLKDAARVSHEFQGAAEDDRIKQIVSDFDRRAGIA